MNEHQLEHARLQRLWHEYMRKNKVRARLFAKHLVSPCQAPHETPSATARTAENDYKWSQGSPRRLQELHNMSRRLQNRYYGSLTFENARLLNLCKTQVAIENRRGKASTLKQTKKQKATTVGCCSWKQYAFRYLLTCSYVFGHSSAPWWSNQSYQPPGPLNLFLNLNREADFARSCAIWLPVLFVSPQSHK